MAPTMTAEGGQVGQFKLRRWPPFSEVATFVLSSSNIKATFNELAEDGHIKRSGHLRRWPVQKDVATFVPTCPALARPE